MSVPMKPNDPCYFMLFDGVETTPVVHSQNCYICRDPEFAQMGLPLCRKCPVCGGHVAADDTRCDDCGACDQTWYTTPDLEEIAKYLFVDENYQAVVPDERQMELLKEALKKRVEALLSL